MDGRRVWGRLLWKEFRESGVVLAAGGLCALLPVIYRAHAWLLYTGIALASLLITLWATYRAQRGSDRSRTLLPIAPATGWLALYLLPLPVPLFAGACVGAAIYAFDATQGALGAVLTSAALFMLALFALCTTLTLVYSAIPAIMLGTLFLYAHFDPLIMVGAERRFLWISGAALAGSLLWAPFLRRRRLVSGRLAVGVLLLGAVFGQALVEHLRSISPDAQLPTYHPYFCSGSSDGAVSVGFVRSRGGALAYRDIRTKFQRVHDFADGVLPLALFRETRVVVAEHEPATRRITLSIWDVRAATVREVGRLPAAYATINVIEYASVRPDGRYLLLSTRAKVGRGHDLWIADRNFCTTGFLFG
ncbi:MAG TPA: hypothetical protein PK794_09655, partial [Armatimonadota bacterium]|nr:hypothetical protein [Armatimonadota bacterium]